MEPLASASTSGPPRSPRRVFTPASVLVYFCLLAAALAGLAWGMRRFTAWFEDYQSRRPRYAAERAEADLAANRPEQARAEIKTLLQERPIYVSGFLNLQFSEIYEGPVLRNRAQTYTRLVTELMRAGMWNEAEDVAWKALMEYHIASRAIEWLPPWECLYYIRQMQAAALPPGEERAVSPMAGVFQIARLIAAHGGKYARMPPKMEPYGFSGDTAAYGKLPPALAAGNGAGEMFNPPTLINALKNAYEAETTGALLLAAQKLRDFNTASLDPAITRPLLAEAHKGFVLAGARAEARQLLQKAWGMDPQKMDAFWNSGGQAGPRARDCDPSLLEMYWRDRPSTSTMAPERFLNFFRSDPRVTVLDFKALKTFETGFFQPGQPGLAETGTVTFFGAGAGRMSFNVHNPVRRITFAYSASNALGVGAILLVKLDDQQFIPLYVDDESFFVPGARNESSIPDPKPGMINLDCNLAPGQHSMEIWYINDSGFDWPMRKVHEDRNFYLFNMALVHVAPQ